jgi:transposase
LTQNGISVIFNVPYGPEFNPIERVWAQLKLAFKKKRLETLLAGNTPNYERLLKDILLEYPNIKISSIV